MAVDWAVGKIAWSWLSEEAKAENIRVLTQGYLTVLKSKPGVLRGVL
jgi:hypothetical protein